MKLNETKRNGTKWNGTKWNETKRNEMKWNEMNRIETKWNETKWNEINTCCDIIRFTWTPSQSAYDWIMCLEMRDWKYHYIKKNNTELSPGQTRKHCCRNIVPFHCFPCCFSMFSSVGKLGNIALKKYWGELIWNIAHNK